ncbi:hypothetical protein [Pararhizobium arenae]|uniref:hypothetical protein n=1 Tax=Pararhizobium arenae TaxID=1856850 RepID=UPI00094AD6E8|nr:hypothetical protein [Pararhizobium arenae]
MNYGEQVNVWHEEWQANADLQFQFPLWTDYAFGRRLREAWDASPELQAKHAGDFRSFKTVTKKHASDAALRVREKASRDAAKRTGAKGPVGLFVEKMLGKQQS